MSDQGVTQLANLYDDVYLGVWTNWARGRVLGLTLTLTRNGGGLFIAFLALYVAATGKSFWRLVCLMLHRFLSSQEPQDGLFHQRQVVLRNSETPLQALWELFWMGIAWKKKVPRPFFRTMWLVVVALAISLAWGAAGLFSSRVTTEMASEVLIKGTHCRMPGRLNDGVNENEYAAEYLPWMNKLNTAYMAYAQQCYIEAENVEHCRKFVKNRIPLNITRNATCPFDSAMCKTGSIIIDTGLMNSNIDFGLNMPKESQFQIRTINQCAPITSENRTSVLPQSRFPDNPLMRYHLGNYTNDLGETTDFLHQVPVDFSNSQFEGWDARLAPPAGYEVGVATVRGGESENVTPDNAFEFVPELQRPDGDVSLYFLSAPGIYYSSAVNDPWYSAHALGKKLTGVKGQMETIQSYVQDEPASVMGCISQTQICNPNAPDGSRCQKLGGWREALETLTEPWGENPSKEITQLLEWIKEALSSAYIPLDKVVEITSDHALSARFRLNSFSQISDNQWEEEVLRWTAASTASIQGLFVQLATGAKGLNDSITASPDNAQAWKMCRAQRIVSTNFSSFNVIGILVIIIIGAMIIILDLTLETCIDIAQQKNARHDYGRLEWKSNAALQLHRMAHESIGSGTWTKIKNMIPITKKWEPLGQLDVSNPEHPRLFATPRKNSDISFRASIYETYKGLDHKSPYTNFVEYPCRVRTSAELHTDPSSGKSSMYSEQYPHQQQQIDRISPVSSYTSSPIRSSSTTIRSNRDYYARFSVQGIGNVGNETGVVSVQEQEKTKKKGMEEDMKPSTAAQKRYYAK